MAHDQFGLMGPTGSPLYGALAILGLGITAWIWWRRTQRGDLARDPRLIWIAVAALLGAFLGSTLAFLFADGWAHRHEWSALLSGRSITGGLIGGVLAAEWLKWRLGIRTPTGDLFAVTVPLALALGRIGCVSAGCCRGVECESQWWTVADRLGVARWPNAELECAFNIAFLAWVLVAARFGWQRHQRFNLYLVLYGAARFGAQFMRDEPRWIGPLGGYHLSAAIVFVLGVVLYLKRQRGLGLFESRSITEREPREAISRS